MVPAVCSRGGGGLPKPAGGGLAAARPTRELQAVCPVSVARQFLPPGRLFPISPRIACCPRPAPNPWPPPGLAAAYPARGP